MVNVLDQVTFERLSLQTTFQGISDLQRQHVTQGSKTEI